MNPLVGKPLKVRSRKKGVVTLTNKEYKAAGGFGAVFCLDDIAYKVYHNPKNMIPKAKIRELSSLKQSDILSPIESLYDVESNDPIGFTMKYIQGFEFLVKLFTKTFRDNNHLSPINIADLVLKMQKTLKYIHKEGFLVVDYNEMNFLISKDMKTVYHIDVDAWKTPNFKADALMESVRDRLVKKGQFTEFSDWFSWAIVTFQMYIGIHPYKGFHNNYKPKQWMQRMDDGVSVFDSGAKSLPNICQDYSVIPKRHLDWYKEVFKNNERSIPPYPDGVLVVATVDRIINSKGDFIVKEVFHVNEPIRNIFFLNNNRYVLTSKAIYDYKKNKIITFTESMKFAQKGMCDVFGENPLVVYFKNLKVRFNDLNNRSISTIKAEDLMSYNGLIYTVNNGRLVEHLFERIGKIIHQTIVTCNLSSSYKVYQGVIVQDDFMKIRLAIPFSKGRCINTHIRELDGQRIMDARYDKGVCIIMTEGRGQYFKYTVCFDKAHYAYIIKKENITDYYPINFIVLPNKLCVSMGVDKLSLFKDNTGKKEVTDLPFDASMRLYHDNMQVLFVNDRTLYSISMN